MILPVVVSGLKLMLAVIVWALMACFAGFWILVVGPILVIGVICHSGMTALTRGLRCIMAKLPLNHIQNNEEGLSVRDKLNTVIDRINATNNIEGVVDNHSGDTSNPHKVKAPQVALEPIITPLAPNEQNVQDALEWLYGHFEQHANEGWHLDHIDGIYTVIQINRGPNTQFPPEPADLRVGELKLDWNEGKLWTKLGDDSDVIIGGKGVIFEAPLDGELYGRKVSETDPTVGDWYRISLATVSDDMPQNPSQGDLWVDTKNTLELYVYVDDNGWVSMTGAGSGGGEIPDNITTDDIDGTMVNKLLGREMDEEGAKIWRPIYTSDVITEGAQPMFRSTETGQFTKATDPAAIRDQQTANWFLYETMMALESGASVTIDTQAPQDPSDGDFWFDNTEEVMQLFVYHEASDAWIPVAPPATLESRVRAGELTQEAIIAQIQESLEEQARIRDSLDSASSDLDGKVSLSGTNNLDHTTRWRIKQRMMTEAQTTPISLSTMAK